MNFLVPQALAQAILDYLVQRPYAEVHQLVASFQQIPRAPETVEPALEAAEPVHV